VWRDEGFSEEWREGIITPIHKKGALTEVTNYRGVTLLCSAYKLYAAVLTEKLRKETGKESTTRITGRLPKRQRHGEQYIYPATCN